MSGRTGVLVLAAGADWEPAALPALSTVGCVVVRRCVDLADLMGSATVGTAGAALVDSRIPVDVEAIAHLARHGVRTVVVARDDADGSRYELLGVAAVVGADAEQIARAVERVSADDVPVLEPEVLGDLAADADPPAAPIVAVWGAAGAPGRTTVATNLAVALARSHSGAVLVDGDPYGGTVAQHLGILDEVSGVLAVARLANSGGLDRAALVSCARRAGELAVLTGLPRPDRRVEVRPGGMERVLDVASGLGPVVVDCGFCLEEDDPAGRDRMTLEALAVADQVVVVGGAEPSGLARLARGLVDVTALLGPVSIHVVVNRMRSTLGWSERDLRGMVEGYVRPDGITFLPHDQAAVDRSLVAGRSIVELADSVLAKELEELAATVAGQLPNSR